MPTSDHRESRLLGCQEEEMREAGEEGDKELELLFSIDRWYKTLVLVLK